MMMRRAWCALAVVVMGVSWVAGAAWAQDADGDTIPDDLEVELGTDPRVAESLELVLDDKAQGEGDKSISSKRKLALDFTRVWFGHIAGERYLWKIELSPDAPLEGSVFHTYVDLDNDLATGRQDSEWVRGTDAMYSFLDGKNDPRIIHAPIRVNEVWPVRGFARGNVIWVCDDVHIAAEDGATAFRMRLLSHRKDDTSDNDTHDWMTVTVPLHRDRALVKLPYPELEGFEHVEGSHELVHDLQWHADTVPLYSLEPEVEGLVRLHNGDLSVGEEETQRAVFTVPAEGSYHVVALVRSPGVAAEVSLNDTAVGTFVGRSRSRPGGLVFSSEKVSFEKGDRLAFAVPRRSNKGSFGELMLTTVKPEELLLRLEHIETAVLPAPPGETREPVVICWTTSRATEGALEIGEPGKPKQVIEEGRGPQCNHRLVLPASYRAPEYEAQLTARVEETVSKSEPVTIATSRPTPGGLKPGEVALSVDEPTDLDREAWPVTSGVPFAKGILGDAQRCELRGPDGKAIPGQFRALAYWPDGSVKWLLIDFLASTQGGQEQVHRLRYNVAPGPAPETFRITDTKGGLTVETGELRAELSSQGFDPFGAISVGGRPVTSPTAGVELTDGEGNPFLSGAQPVEEMVVEAAGPVRTTVRVRGHFADEEGKQYMAYLCRLHFYAGQPWVRVVFSLDNDVLNPRMNLVSQLACPLKMKAQSAGFGVGEGSVPVAVRARLLQDDDDHCVLHNGGEAITAERAPGYCRLEGERALTVAVRDFWQLYPKGFRATAEGVRVELLPQLPADQYQSPEDQELLTQLYFWCDKGRYKLSSGVRVTTEFWVDFGDAIDAEEFNAAVQQPLFAACSPEQYCAAGAVGPMAPRREGAWPAYEAALDKGFEGFLKRREDVREYGFINYGDWFGERTWNWGNIEYDTQHALGLNFMRTGRIDMLWRAEEAEWHNADVDVIHYDANPSNIGKPHVHCLGHAGGYFERDWKDMGYGFIVGSSGLGHTWDRGHFLLWALTGEERYRATGDETAMHIATVQANNVNVGSHRDGGWALIGTTGAYQHTRDPYYLNASRIVAGRVLDKQRPNGQWGHFIDGSECKHRPQHWGCKPFMTGVILHGLAMLHRIEPTDEVREALLRGADYLWERCYVADSRSFFYSECPTFAKSVGTWSVYLPGDGLAYACLLDPDRERLPQVLELWANGAHLDSVSSFGKGFTQQTCFVPFMLGTLAELGVTDLPKPKTPDEAWLRETIIGAPGERVVVRPFVLRHGDRGGRCELRAVGRRPSWLTLDDKGLRWEAAPGLSAGPEIEAIVPNAPGRASLRLKCGETAMRFTLRVTPAEPMTTGAAVGWVTGEGDHLAEAAGAVGETVEAIADVGEADLSRYGTIVLGAEAFNKDFARVRRHFGRLTEFVLSGGWLVAGQLNDEEWRLGFLAADLMLDDAETSSGETIAREHPLFAGLTGANALAGVVSYDHIAYAAPEWNVLMTAANGTPAILECAAGKGRVLVVIPSFDRVVTGTVEQEQSPLLHAACERLMRNLVRLCRKRGGHTDVDAR